MCAVWKINSVAFSNEDKKECSGLVNGHLALFITRDYGGCWGAGLGKMFFS